MKARIDYTNVPEALRGMYQLEHYIHNSDLEESLVHLVNRRASQINGYAYCRTAKMDDMSVVDSKLRVYGVKNLMVADGSIMPRVTTGNTHGPCVIIGERMTELLSA